MNEGQTRGALQHPCTGRDAAHDNSAVPHQRATDRRMSIRSLSIQDAQHPIESLHALDWLNFFLAALLMGLGPFLASSLSDRGWSPANIGFLLSVSGFAGLLTQVPAGELIDMAKSKRTLIATGTAAVTLALLIYGLRTDFPSVFTAAVIQGMSGSVLGPAVAAISLGLVGNEALAQRLGRNQRFASIGGLTAAGFMGVIGYLVPLHDIFLMTAALGLPVLLALARIRAADIHFARSCGAHNEHPTHPQRVSRAVLFKDRRLLAFATCLFLFQIANASMLPLLGERL